MVGGKSGAFQHPVGRFSSISSSPIDGDGGNGERDDGSDDDALLHLDDNGDDGGGGGGSGGIDDEIVPPDRNVRPVVAIFPSKCFPMVIK